MSPVAAQLFHVDSRKKEIEATVIAIRNFALSPIKVGAIFPLTHIHHYAHSTMFIVINSDINARPVHSYRSSVNRTKFTLR